MRYECCLFDLDGTLLDTLDDLFAAVNYALSAHGLPLRTREEVRLFIGNGIVKLMERAVGRDRNELAEFDGVLADFKGYYGAHCEDRTLPYAGIEELLAALKHAGVKIGVVSNKAAFAVEKLCKTFFGESVDVAIGENEDAGIRKKPAPDTVLAAMEALGASRESTVYIGDSEVDIQTAKNAGIPCVSVAWGMKDRAFLTENGATVLAESPKELMEIIL